MIVEKTLTRVIAGVFASGDNGGLASRQLWEGSENGKEKESGYGFPR
jgi:hypothetical protein